MEFVFNVRWQLAFTGLLLMRVVAGSAPFVGPGLTLGSDPPPLNVIIPAMLLIGTGILLIAGSWTPIAGTLIALTEIWKMLMLPGDKWVWLMLAPPVPPSQC